MSADHPNLAPWKMLPAPKDTCQVCATKHEPENPHNQQSFFYLYDFYGKHGRWPTWGDAMAHCTPEMKAYWCEALKQAGVPQEELEPSKETAVTA